MTVRRLLVSVVVTLAALCVSASPALAAAPEPPLVTVEPPVHATTATFLGIVSPAATEPVEGGTYRFLYKPSSTGECEGGSVTTPGLYAGNPAEALPAEPVSGLSPGTEYAVCLSVTNNASETTVGPAESFTTARPPETPVTTSPAVSVTTSSATLEGVVNPHAPETRAITRSCSAPRPRNARAKTNTGPWKKHRLV